MLIARQHSPSPRPVHPTGLLDQFEQGSVERLAGGAQEVQAKFQFGSVNRLLTVPRAIPAAMPAASSHATPRGRLVKFFVNLVKELNTDTKSRHEGKELRRDPDYGCPLRASDGSFLHGSEPVSLRAYEPASLRNVFCRR